MQDVFDFALTLQSAHRTTFILVFSATCWTVWKHRNEIIFQNLPHKTARTLIYLILSLVVYWTGSKRTKKIVRAHTQYWLPREDMMDAIPLRVIWPGEEESMTYQADDSSTQESS